MPIYEYQCGSCGRRFEQLQRITEDALTTDPDCGGPVRRVIQPVGIIFKGSGFYVNDSRKTSSSSTGTTSDSSKSEGKAEGKSETKSETKSDSGKSESSSSSDSSSSSSSSKPSDSKPAAAAAS
jgi:putative FmdB family regulatory protein